MVQVFDQHSEISTLLQKTEPKPSNFDSENEYSHFLADIKAENRMSRLLGRLDILSQYEDEKSYSELAQYDIRDKCHRLEKFDYETDNLKELSDMAIQKYGFIKTKYRRKAWSRLVQSQSQKNSTIEKQNFDIITTEQIRSNKYFNQVTLDVARTLKRFPPEINDSLRAQLQDELIDSICKILIRNDKLHYYQGYHDICLTFLLVNGVEQSLPLIEDLTLTHLTPFMETNMESTLKLLLNIMPLINEMNSDVADHLQKAELGVIFSLSWLITWYSHVTDNIQIIMRLYDFFIATDPLMPVYFGAVIVVDKADEVLGIECEMSSLHTIISKYPSKIEDIEILEKYIEKSVSLFNKYPPKHLTLLNSNWLEKCKKIKDDQLKAELEYRRNVKKRQSRKTPRKTISLFKKSENAENSDDELNHSVVKRNNLALKPVRFANRFIVGLTFTVGVAAIATMYALNSTKDPNEMLSKVIQLIT